MKRKYAWIPDLPDKRDFLYSSIKKPVELPDSVDLRDLCPPVEDQGELGSCTAQALVGNLEFLELKTGDCSLTNLSRLFVYYNERELEGTVGQDAGAMLRDGIKVLNKHGVCPEYLWPYLIDRFDKKPSLECYSAAEKRKIISYHRLYTLGDMLQCLAEGYPFVFGFTVYDGFESEEVRRTGRLEMPGSRERSLGGHAVMAVGYDNLNDRLLVRNSWGSDWGMAGYFTMPFDYVEFMAEDFWTVRK